jgi:hypothetical protein
LRDSLQYRVNHLANLVRQGLGFINQACIPEAKLAHDLKLTLKLEIRTSSDTKKLAKLASTQPSLASAMLLGTDTADRLI